MIKKSSLKSLLGREIMQKKRKVWRRPKRLREKGNKKRRRKRKINQSQTCCHLVLRKKMVDFLTCYGFGWLL